MILLIILLIIVVGIVAFIALNPKAKQSDTSNSRGMRCCLVFIVLGIILFAAPAVFITWENLTWESRADESYRNSGPQMFQEILDAPSTYQCMKFLKDFRDMEDECKIVSHILDSIILKEYQEADTDVVKLAYFVYCNHSLEGTPTVEKYNKLSQERLNKLWDKDSLLAEYGMRHYEDLASFLFYLNEDYGWRWAQLSGEYEGFREHYPNSKYDKLAYRGIIEQAIESGEYEELQPMKKISSSKDNVAELNIDNRTDHPITVTFLSVQHIDEINKISIPKSSVGIIKINPDDYMIYAHTDDKTNIRAYASKYTKISSGVYELQFVVKTYSD